MNKGYLVLGLALMLFLSVAFVSAERGENNGSSDDERGPMLISSGPDSDLGNDSNGRGDHENETQKREIRSEIYHLEGDNEIEVEREGNKTKLKIKNSTAHSELEIESERNNETNETKFKVHFSNGRNSEIKIMPDSASERALERLRIRVCNESNNCTIQLKETGQGNETRASYEVQAERHFKLLGLFERKAQVRAEVDAESGNVTSVGKPWWSFLASQPAE